ncbi:MAG: glutamate--tRNA ligase [Candidatus Aminicenantes bacterium]|nr:MAG: glutamate--tRNA ligase [Candidatus Aminicenantes bacterium]
MKNIRVRFAPSPTGFLHVGNARTALFNWLFARQQKGTFVLRIEDTDIERSALEYEEKLKEDLLWLGLDWDEGPDAGGAFGPYRQSLRLDIYKDYTHKLLDSGKAYRCFCTTEDLETERKEAQAKSGVAIYSGKCANISATEALQRIQDGEKASVRLRTPGRGALAFPDLVRGELKFDLSLIGDPIIVRSTGHPAYNFAVVVDDSLMEITHVIRGEDHISNTPRQILVYQALSLVPPHFAHLSMVMGRDGTRLSKRHGATAVDQFQKDGVLSPALFNYLALLGWAPPEDQEVLSPEEMIGLFDLKKVSRSAAIFDYDKLYWINRQHTKTLSVRQMAEMAFPHMKSAELLPDIMTEAHWDWLEKVMEVFIERVDRFADFPLQVDSLFRYSPVEMDEETKKEMEGDCASRVVSLFGQKIANIEHFDYAQFVTITQEIKQDTGCKGKDLYHPLRIALTTRSSGLDLDKFIPLVEEGARLDLPRSLKNCCQRIYEMLGYLQQRGSIQNEETES